MRIDEFGEHGRICKWKLPDLRQTNDKEHCLRQCLAPNETKVPGFRLVKKRLADDRNRRLPSHPGDSARRHVTQRRPPYCM